MSLSIVSNQAAQVANQQLNRIGDQVNEQAEQLASGLRVNSAQDDVAASAISSRLEAEVSGLEQANRNAEQAGSLLQIADGAFNNTENQLQRAQQLAVQAGSDNVSDDEREFLDQEFQSILSEIDRLSEDTEFSGRQLVSGSINATGTANLASAPAASVTMDDFGAMGVTFSGSDADMPSLTVSSVTLQAVNTGTTALTTGGDTGQVSLNATFQGITTADGAMTSFTGSVTGQNVSVTGTNVMLTEAATVVASPSMDNGTGAGSFSVMFSSGDTLTMTASFGTGAANAATVSGGTVSFTGAEVEMLNFAVGTGTDETADQIEVSVGSINTTALGLDGTDLLSRSSAEQTNGAIDTALDTLANRRSDVAAAQNRLDAAQNNVDAAVQNQSAANSSLIELNVADASTEFSQNQVRFQAASSTLTQAQQLPQNLLGLFQ